MDHGTGEKHIERLVKAMEDQKPFFLELGEKILELGQGKIYKDDLFFFGILNRALELLDGMSHAIKTSNLTTGGGLMRMYLETAFILHWLVSNPSKDGGYYARFQEQGKVVKANGKDEKLAEMFRHFSSQYPEFNDMWNSTNELIHFSDRATYLATAGVSDSGFQIKVAVGNPNWFRSGEMEKFVRASAKISQIIYGIIGAQIELVRQKNA